MMTRVNQIDSAVDVWFDKLRGNAFFDRLFYLASTVGDHSAIWFALALLRRFQDGNWYVALRVIIAIPIESFLVNVLVKSMFRRSRPVHEQERPHRLRTPRTSSFPSGHATSAFTAATLLSVNANPIQIFSYFALAFIVALSRIHVRIHHASDVSAGIVFGLFLGLVGRLILF